MQNFRLIALIVYLFLHALKCIVRTISKTGRKRANYITMHYPGRKPVYFLGSLVLRLVSFASFMRLRTQCNVGLITSELKGLTKKLSFTTPSRYYIKCKIASHSLTSL